MLRVIFFPSFFFKDREPQTCNKGFRDRRSDMNTTWSSLSAPKTRLHKEGLGVNKIEPGAVLRRQQLWLLARHISKTTDPPFASKQRPQRLQTLSGLHGSSASKSGALTAGDALSPRLAVAAATLQGTLQGGMTPSFPDHAPIQAPMFGLKVTNLPFFGVFFPLKMLQMQLPDCNWALVFPLPWWLLCGGRRNGFQIHRALKDAPG